MDEYLSYAFLANVARRTYSSCDQINITITYKENKEDILIGTFLFKNSTGSTVNRIWCEFKPSIDAEL